MNRAHAPSKQFGFRAWYQLGPDESPLFACVPVLCGHDAFQTAINPATNGGISSEALRNKRGPFAPHEIMNRDGRKLLAIRDPVERFADLWHSVMANSQWAVHKLRIHEPMITPDDLLRVMIKNPMVNHHWYPQYAYMVQGVVLVRHDRMLSKLGLPEGARGASPVRLLDMPTNDIRAVFSADYNLWRMVSDNV
jgi:hypothetical protein